MAKRLNLRHSEMVRAKIKASCVIKALMEHLEGTRELSSTQVASAKILLDKSLSNPPEDTNLNVSGGTKIQVEWV